MRISGQRSNISLPDRRTSYLRISPARFSTTTSTRQPTAFSNSEMSEGIENNCKWALSSSTAISIPPESSLPLTTGPKIYDAIIALCRAQIEETVCSIFYGDFILLSVRIKVSAFLVFDGLDDFVRSDREFLDPAANGIGYGAGVGLGHAHGH